MTTSQLEQKLYEFIRPIYPNIEIKVVDTTDNVRQLYFTEEKFQVLYPKQRFHYLVHAIPADFFDQYLQNTTWFELAPDENPDELDYYDQEEIDENKDMILSVLKDQVNFVSLLDKEFVCQSIKCLGDFRYSKKILTDLEFSTNAQSDIFHVLMNEGAYCDCEILYNVFRESEYSQKYWRDRQA
jgi:hypothetical protein